MLRFYLIRRDKPSDLQELVMGHEGCLRIASQMPSTTLTKDVEEWRDKAQHGDTFRISHDRTILALDLIAVLDRALKPKEIEVCERLCDHTYRYEKSSTGGIAYVQAPKYHACLKGNTGVWAAGVSPYEAIGDLVCHHPEAFGIEVSHLEGRQPR